MSIVPNVLAEGDLIRQEFIRERELIRNETKYQ